jgi:hemerythrin-like domain-containing protein
MALRLWHSACTLQYLNKDTNAVPTAFHKNVSGEDTMPSRQNDQEHPMDAIAMLKADHQRVRDLFAQYEATEHAETKRTLAEQVFVELETHAQLEQNVFYPAVNEGTDEGPDLVKDSVQEHEIVHQLMQELQGMAHDTDAFEAKFHELMDAVEHHVEEEEAAMFPLAEEELAEDLDEMMAEMQEMKADLQGS